MPRERVAAAIRDARSCDERRDTVAALPRSPTRRTGDKGNRSNISVIACDPALWPLLVEQVTEERVARAVRASPAEPACTRYLLPKLHAMNFVLDDVLDGGVNDALNLDSHGKALSFLLLDLPIDVPTRCARTSPADDPIPLDRPWRHA